MNDQLGTVIQYIIKHHPVKLNLGCGNDFKENHINVDSNTHIQYLETSDFVVFDGDVLTFLMSIPQNSVEHVQMDYFVEHLTPRLVSELLYRLHKVLIEEGTITISTEDYDAVFRNIDKFYDGKIDFLHFHVFGDELDTYHRSIWNEALAKYYIERENLFKIVSLEKDTENFQLRINASVIK